MRSAYLTIDDSPSARTGDLVKFLNTRNIPALLFVRGDHMQQFSSAIANAIRNGIVIGNHSFAHIPAGEMSFDQWQADFEQCEVLINMAYKQAGVRRTHLYYRFPYIDRGDGVRVERNFAKGEGAFTSNAAIEKIQIYLKTKGFSQPFENMPEGYPDDAADCLFTYTSGDWMLTARHKGQHQYKSLDDLKSKIDKDLSLQQSLYNHVFLLHDQAEIHDEVCTLIDYFTQSGFKFLDIDANT